MVHLLKALQPIVNIAAMIPWPGQPFVAAAAVGINILPADLPPMPNTPDLAATLRREPPP